ncbi:MAG TPA: hypothetical protein VG407_04880 [Caulobacteraceae bacterium]|nr:hypothetical protein [Caulobacteraceae bacterium]
MDERTKEILTKVPAVTLGFWIIKILCTTLGETGADSVTMTLFGETTPDADKMGVNGYLAGIAIFGAVLVVMMVLQILAKKFHPWLYWLTIIASTTAGTAMADFADRSLGIGYPGGSLLLFACVIASLMVWRFTLGSVSVNTIISWRQEIFYWITITFSQTLGTALGDWVGDEKALGYAGGAAAFSGALGVVAALYFFTKVNRVLLFWAAFILTRPLGATVGDFFDKPLSQGGIGVERPIATAILAILIVTLIIVLPQKSGRHPGAEEEPVKS